MGRRRRRCFFGVSTPSPHTTHIKHEMYGVVCGWDCIVVSVPVTCIHAYMHTCIHAYMHTCIHAYIHACIHTHIHTYTHTYIQTYIRVYINLYTSITYCVSSGRPR